MPHHQSCTATVKKWKCLHYVIISATTHSYCNTLETGGYIKLCRQCKLNRLSDGHVEQNTENMLTGGASSIIGEDNTQSIFTVHSTNVPNRNKFNYLNYSTPKISAVRSYETSLNVYETTRHHIPDDSKSRSLKRRLKSLYLGIRINSTT
jgi:hypothetical protein